MLRTFEAVAVKARQLLTQIEGAGKSTRQIFAEVVNPVHGIDPTSLPLGRTADLKGMGGSARIAEGNHGYGEAHLDLPNGLDRILGIEAENAGFGRALTGDGRGNRGLEQKAETGERQDSHAPILKPWHRKP